MGPEINVFSTEMTARDLTQVPRLDGTNFSLWKIRVNIIFEKQELLDVVLGNDVCPTQTTPVSEAATAAIKNWRKKDVAARDIIVSTMEPSLCNILLTCTTAASMRKRLESQHQKSSSENQHIIQHRFF